MGDLVWTVGGRRFELKTCCDGFPFGNTSRDHLISALATLRPHELEFVVGEARLLREEREKGGRTP